MQNATTDLTSVIHQGPPQSTTALGFGNTNPLGNAPVPPSGWELSEARRKREEAAKPSDYLMSMWRQDSAIQGAIETWAGSNFVPQKDYFAGTDPEFKNYTNGIWIDHVKELYQANSPAHALFIRDRLLQKQEDLLRLSDMGWKGKVARVVLSILTPDQLLMSMAGGWVTKGNGTYLTLAGTKLQRQGLDCAGGADPRVDRMEFSHNRPVSPEASPHGS